MVICVVNDLNYGLGVLRHNGVHPPPEPPFFTPMFLLYTDASGTPELADNSLHYVLLGVCVHEGTWFGLNKRVERLKTRYCSPGTTFELHCAEFAIQIREQEQIANFADLSWSDTRNAVMQIRQQRLDAAHSSEERSRLREKFKRTASYVHLTRAERSRLLEDTLDLVGSHEGVRLFAEAVSKRHAGVVSGSVNPLSQAFEQVVSRFDTFLQRRHLWKLQRSDRPTIDNGLLILDQDYATEATIRRQFENFREHGHPWGILRHVVDIPFYASSERLAGLQLADVCAYALRRYLDKGAVAGSHEERNFLRIAHRFDHDTGGRLHGVRHFTAPASCACWICHRRGHATPEHPLAGNPNPPTPNETP